MKLSKRAEDLLLEILEHRDERGNCNTEYWKKRFEILSGAEDILVRSLFKELREEDMISVQWADDYPYILFVLGKGLAYFEEPQVDNTLPAFYTNNFYGDVSEVQIQQGNNNISQTMIDDSEFDKEKIEKLIDTISSYDSVLNQEYGINLADELRNAIKELNVLLNEQKENPGKMKSVLNYIKELSVNAGGGLIASGVVDLIQMIMR